MRLHGACLLLVALTGCEGATKTATGGTLTVTAIEPTDAWSGDEIRIHGAHLEPLANDLVTFDGGQPMAPTGGNDELITVVVPHIDLGTASRRSVLVRVDGGARGAGTATLTVHADGVIPAGAITVSPGDIPANITPGSDVVFPFTIEARTNADESYRLVPGLPAAPAGQTAWTAALSGDAAGAGALPQPLFIPAPAAVGRSSRAQVFVKLSIPADATLASPFVKLDVRSVHNPPPNPGSPSGGSGPVSFAFAQPAQPAQTVRFAISSFTGDGVMGDPTTVAFPLPTPMTAPVDGIEYVFWNLRAGQYELTLAWQDTGNDNGGWVASFGGAPGVTPGWPITEKTITMNAPGDWGPEKVAIVGRAGASPNTLVITVRAVGADAQTDYGILRQGITGD